MRVALIGNMNNCFFSLMRYLRDLDVDTHLFMYQNEYQHFMPENDTYQIDKYQDYIHYISVESSGKGLILANIETIKKELEEYDFFIGFGLAPALFRKLNYQLDIFIPYSDHIELTINEKFQFKNIIKYPIRMYTINKQIEGIKYNTTKIIASGIMNMTKDSISKLGVEDKLIKQYLMMIYNQEKITVKPNPKYLAPMLNRDIVIFSHTRHYWKDLIEEYEKKEGVKGSDKLIIGYNEFIKANKNINSILILFEYGKDVDASKELITQLGIDKYVQWFPMMPRKDILNLIDYADIVVDSVLGEFWGGVGFEGLSRGKIIMQNVLKSDDEYYQIIGHKPPFIMRSNRGKDVEKNFTKFIKNKTFYREKSIENRDWFNKYAGMGLAKEYKKIIEQLYQNKCTLEIK